MPWTIKNYKLDELTGPHALRSNLSFLFRQHNNVKDPKAVDILIYKGREELEVRAHLLLASRSQLRLEGFVTPSCTTVELKVKQFFLEWSGVAGSPKTGLR